ncbi:AAA family ATPase [Streptomyces sp. NPDC058290]|uniref:AAA family ATPase n=1 Tax=Streptomyces sp. NPDC058290 TaxID=3346426 RepID=UPI0036E3F6F0
MEASFQRPELIDLLEILDTPGHQGVLVLGNPGVGKSVLLQQLETELRRRGRAAFLVSLRDADVADLLALIMNEIAQMVDVSEVEFERTIRASGGDGLRQVIAALNQVTDRLTAPVLLLDGLDEAGYPQRMAAAVEELSHGLDAWTLVLASRLADIEYRRFGRQQVYERVRTETKQITETEKRLRQTVARQKETIAQQRAEIDDLRNQLTTLTPASAVLTDQRPADAPRDAGGGNVLPFPAPR